MGQDDEGWPAREGCGAITPGGRVGGLGPGWPLQSWGARLAQLAGVASELEVGLEARRGTEARAGETESRS